MALIQKLQSWIYSIFALIMLATLSCYDTRELTFDVTNEVPIALSLEEIRSRFEIQSAKPMHILGQMQKIDQLLFVVDEYKGFHVVDYTFPSNPKRMAFVQLPGNIELLKDGNKLFANSGPDIVVFEINGNQFHHFGNIKMALEDATSSFAPDEFIVGYEFVTEEVTTTRRTGRFWNDDFSSTAPSPPFEHRFITNKFAVANDLVSVISFSSVVHYDVKTGGEIESISESSLFIIPDADQIYTLDSFLITGISTFKNVVSFDGNSIPNLVDVGPLPMQGCGKIFKQNDFYYAAIFRNDVCITSSNFISIGKGDNPLEIAAFESLSFIDPMFNMAVDTNTLFVAFGELGFKGFDASQIQITTADQWANIDVDARHLLVNDNQLFVNGKGGVFLFQIADKALSQISKILIQS